MPIELPKRENLMPFIEIIPGSLNYMTGDQDAVTAFLSAVPDRESQIKYFENSYNYEVGKTYDPNYVLFFRRTLPSNKPKHEERRTNIYFIVRNGLGIEIPNGPHRLHTIILCDTLQHITTKGEKKGNTNPFTDGEIVVNLPNYNQNTCLFKFKPQEEKRQLDEYLREEGSISEEKILEIIQDIKKNMNYVLDSDEINNKK